MEQFQWKNSNGTLKTLNINGFFVSTSMGWELETQVETMELMGTKWNNKHQSKIPVKIPAHQSKFLGKNYLNKATAPKINAG